MESAAPFDLNDAIRQWRTNWAEVSSLRREDQERMNQLVRWCLSHPLLPFLGIVFLNYGWRSMWSWTLNWLTQVVPQIIPTQWHAHWELHRTLDVPILQAWWI
jgi:hypothetical protein